MVSRYERIIIFLRIFAILVPFVVHLGKMDKEKEAFLLNIQSKEKERFHQGNTAKDLYLEKPLVLDYSYGKNKK